MIKITYTPEFKKEYKRLAKKFSSLEADIQSLIQELYLKPDLGQPLGAHTYKIRWQVKSKGKGRSGGIRVITYYLLTDSKLYLLNLYDKSEKSSMSSKEIQSIIESIVQ